MKRSLVLLALTAGAGALWWLRSAAEWRSLAVAIALAVVSALLAFADYVAITRLFNRTTIRAGRDALAVRHGPLPAFVRDRRIPSSDVAQLFVAPTPYDSYEVRALRRGGAIETVVELLPTAEEARDVEARLEEALGLVDRPVEAAPAEELAARPVESGPSLGPALALVALLAAGVASGFLLHTRVVRGDELGAVHVGDPPSTLELHVASDRPAVVFWAEVDLTVPTGIDDPSIQRMPHLVDYAITVEQGGAVVATLRCNLFDSHVFDWSSRIARWDGADHAWRGRLEGCAVRLAPGAATVRVERVWRQRPAGVTLRKSVLVAMAYR